MIVSIKEIDTLIKGDGRPFNAGENIYRNSDLNTLNINIYSVLKKMNNDINILKMFFYDIEKEDLIVPLPQDISLHKIELIKAKIKLTMDNQALTFYQKAGKIKNIDGFVNLENLKHYLFDEPEFHLKKEDLIKLKESSLKVGIELNHLTKNAEIGKLYFEEDIKLLENICIICEVENVKIVEEIMSFGAENKVSRFKKENLDIKKFLNDKGIKPQEIKSYIKQSKYFKIILLTPTNYPPEIDGAKRIAQIIGKPIPFSGWFNVYEDGKKIDSFPSRLFKLIPAGSVFYYKLEEEHKLDEIFDKHWLKPSFFVPEYPYFESKNSINPLCFGLSIIGVANIEKQEDEL